MSMPFLLLILLNIRLYNEQVENVQPAEFLFLFGLNSSLPVIDDEGTRFNHNSAPLLVKLSEV